MPASASERVRLSAFYGVYFAGLGAFGPYWGLYLDSIGQTALQIGFLTALVQVTRVFAPHLWGSLADRTGQRQRVVHWATLASALSFVLLFWGQSFWWAALATFLYSFFASAALPLVEATTLDWARRMQASYGRIRLWGSLGFIVFALGLGILIDGFGPQAFLVTCTLLFLGAWLVSLPLPRGEPHPHHAAAGESLGQLLRRPGVLAFFLACALEQASHGPYYAFYSIYLQQHGFSGVGIGLMWAFAVACEVGFFLASDRIIAYLGLRALLLGSFVLTTVRWVLIGLWPGLGWVIFAQALHAASYGAFHAAALNLTYQQFPPALRARGQALYSSLAFGLGGAIGGALAGWTWGQAGGGASYAVAAVLAFLGLLLAARATGRMAVARAL